MEVQSLDSYYGILLESLLDFQAAIESSADFGREISEKFAKIEQMYREKILTLEAENDEKNDLDGSYLWRSLQTETHKMLRLLQTDIIFLQSSRQAATRQQRKANCLAKIERLIGYCQQILTELGKD
ncbi:MAG: heterocyst frequency control protein PatD [Cyanobacteria bacterium SBLK]|nr:heterocyst frequency control protein PatD [Cyanobacteria bacterium SBLK]